VHLSPSFHQLAQLEKAELGPYNMCLKTKEMSHGSAAIVWGSGDSCLKRDTPAAPTDKETG
jgi:hypothetical protein